MKKIYAIIIALMIFFPAVHAQVASDQYNLINAQNNLHKQIWSVNT